MRWRVRLFEGPVLEGSSGEQIRRFRSRRVGALLGYLALRLGHRCTRAELADAIWPEESDELVIANRLRVTLASLRRQMEPPGEPFGSVIDVSVPGCVSLRAEAVWVDAVEIDSLIKAGNKQEASRLMNGELLPGYFEDWAVLERLRFDALADQVSGSSPEIGERRSPPPKVATGRDRSCLPLYLTQFFGRDREREQLLRLLENKRLVTLTGPGGVGKTRLAIEVADEMPMMSVFLSLVEVQPQQDIAEAVLGAFAVLPSAEGNLFEQVVSVLGRRGPVLLILDNAEHLVDRVAEIVLRLLQAVPGLRLLVTSRQRLEVPGEVILPLLPLQSLSERETSSSPAVALFLDRARNARPDFVLSDRNRRHILEICQLLQGMPLALELAAARVVAQSPEQIADTLKASLIELGSRQRGLSPRHRTIRASISGSFEMLSPEARSFVAKLSAFRGGWTAAAAREVTGNAETEALLEDLTARSIVYAREDPAGSMRYAFLDSIRQFAQQQLGDEEAGNLADLHAEYFLALAARVSEDDEASLRPLDREQDNLLAALEHRPRRAGYWEGLIGALLYAHVRGKHRAYLRYAEEASAMAKSLEPVELRVGVRVAAYFVLSYVGRLGMIREIGDAIIRDSLEAGYAPGSVLGKVVLGYVEVQQNIAERGLGLAREAVAEARATGRQELVWRSLRINAYVALTYARIASVPPDLAKALLNEAETLSRECLETLPASSIHRTFELLTMAYVLQDTRQEEAYEFLKKAQKAAVEHGMESMMLFCLREGCRFAALAGEFEHAVRLYGAYSRIIKDTGYQEIRDQEWELPMLEHIKGTLGPDRFKLLEEQGARLDAAQVLQMAPEVAPGFPIVLDASA
jgi:predicted ATPase